MSISNRRTLFKTAVAGAAVMALTPARLVGAAQSSSDRMYESELTGSVIEILGTDWKFSHDHIEIQEEADFVREYVLIYSGSGNLEVEFVQTSLLPTEYLELIQGMYMSNYDGFELAGSGTTSDGAWFAASAVSEQLTMSIYCEYQTGAYGDTDLVVRLNSRPDIFNEGISAAQNEVLIGDMEPMMMMQQSQVMSLTFPLPAVATATEASSGRNSRTSSGSSDGDDPSTRGNRSGQNQADTTTSSDYPGAVLEHRTEFMGTFEEFAAALSVTVDDASTDADVSGAFTTIDGLAEQWLGYPDRAAQLVAPAEYSSLEGLYITWADEIATLGSSYLGLYDGTSDVDTMFNQIDVVDQADRALKAELDSL